MLEKIRRKIRSHRITDTHALVWEVVSKKDELAGEQRAVLVRILETQGYRNVNSFILKKNKRDIADGALLLVKERLRNAKTENRQDIEADKEVYTLSLLVRSLQKYLKKQGVEDVTF